ncbi:MAG: carboxynorspermidine decarboxylase [Paludibacteraceae bacterium]|nr:carboxynorspermidine decarboxylase [Paludibacteraceae bacterium]
MNSFNKFDYKTTEIPSPCYVVEEELLHRNLQLIKSVSERSGAEIIMAFKAFAIWKLFDITRQYIPHSTASSLSEARLAFEKLGSKAHTFAPVYKDSEIETIAQCSSHITFNSLAQYERHKSVAEKYGISCGVRINPEYSDVETDLYNPCAPGSRFGIIRDQLPERLPEGIEGLHFHTLCESTSYDLENTLKVVEERFAPWLAQVKWINMGGGHLMTRKDYDTEHLIQLIKGFKARHPHLHVILEPGSAHVWRTGVLVSEIQDIVENHGIRTAIVDVSFACHMPDCLEMPYQPKIIGAKIIDEENAQLSYRMGGNSCLSGDFVGSWQFDHELQIGERIVFEDMNHYTNVKTNMFNGITHPSIALRRLDGTIEILRTYTYEDYLHRMC